MKLIDAHLHLDFYDDLRTIKQQIDEYNILSVFVTHLPELFKKYQSRYAGDSNIILALGYHPVLIEEYELNITLFNYLLGDVEFVGEVGLDYSVTSSREQRSKQRKSFSTICNSVNNQILSIHSRLAEKDVLEILKDCGVRNAIFHWYTGNEKIMDEIIQQGYYFSVNSMMLRSNKGLNILKQIPIDRLLIETDGPFTKFDGGIISPINLNGVYERFSEFYQLADMEHIIWDNFSTLRNKKNHK